LDVDEDDGSSFVLMNVGTPSPIKHAPVKPLSSSSADSKANQELHELRQAVQALTAENERLQRLQHESARLMLENQTMRNSMIRYPEN